MPLSDADRAMLDEVAAEREIDPALVTKVLELETDIPNLDSWGARPELRRRLKDLITAAAGAEA